MQQPDAPKPLSAKVPVRAVARLSVVTNRGPVTSGTGSGVLIDSYHVLTVAHNVVSSDAENPWLAAAVTIRLGSRVGEPAEKQQHYAKCVFCPQAFPRHRSWDIAIVRLDRPVKLDRYPKLWVIDSDSPHQICIAGFPGGDRLATSEGEWSGVNPEVNALSSINLVTAPGSSGSPIFMWDGDQPLVCAVHSGHAEDDKQKVTEDKLAILITQETAEFILRVLAAGDADLVRDGFVVWL